MSVSNIGRDGPGAIPSARFVKKWVWSFVIALLAAVGAAGLFARPWAEQTIVSQASKRGVQLSIGRLELGYPELVLRNVELRPIGLDSASARIDELRVRVAFSSPRLRSIEALGGKVSLDGEIAEVMDAVRAWRERYAAPASSGAGSAGPTRTETLRNLEVEWSDALGAGQDLTIRGLQVDRDALHQEVGADLILAARGDFELQLAGGRLSWEGAGAARQLKKAGAAEMRLSYRLAKIEADAGDQDSPAAAGDSPDKQGASDAGLAARLRADPARVALLQSLLRRFRERVAPRLPREARVEKLWLALEAEGQKLRVGPSRLLLQKSDVDLSVSFVPGVGARGTPLAFKGRLPLSADESVTAQVKGGPISLKTLGVSDGELGVVGAAQTLLAGDAQVKLSPDARTLSAQGHGSVQNLSVQISKISSETLAFPQLSVEGELKYAVDGSSIEANEASLSLGEARFEGSFRAERKEARAASEGVAESPERVLLNMKLRAPLVSCQALADSAPRGILGAVERLRWRGTFSINAGVEADSSQLSKMKVKWDFDNSCRITAAPPELDPQQFRGRFTREVVGSGGFPIKLDFGPATDTWVPMSEISRHMETAVLVTEDGRFFRHDGFDDRAIESSIRDNTRAGRFVRGASTISMQLAKNLYLSRTKTLSRKLQEAALTILLEQTYDKQELLELYLNVVEFGPGIYGIGPAAHYYFATEPRNLSVAQCLFLASILPAPSVSYFNAEGSLSEARTKHLRWLMRIAHKRQRLSEGEFESAEQEVLQFGTPSTIAGAGEQGPFDGSQPDDDAAADEDFGGALAPSPEAPPSSDVPSSPAPAPQESPTP